jgi:hypothetical protein
MQAACQEQVFNSLALKEIESWRLAEKQNPTIP